MSTDLQWMVIRNCSSHLVKKRNIKKYFSRDPLNMKNIHSPRFAGVIHKKALNIEPHSSKPGVVLVYKKRKYQKKPAKNIARVPLTKGARRTMTSIKRFINSNFYRKDLKMVALRRASAILKSQRPVVPKKKTFRKKTD
uniref:Large ribosomal subunit protein eL28 n=1 Tax=Cyriopagopus schmidti TaxID=29017 RepID=B5M6D2_CYRSC|nr:60S ribosomal protein L28 [Cyriopagopus schmidti]